MAGSGVLRCSSGLLSLAFFSFFLVLNLSICDLTWSLLQGKGLEVEKLECCGETWLSQHALGTPGRTSLSPSLASTEPTGHIPWPNLCYSLHTSCRGFRWLQMSLGICQQLDWYWEGKHRVPRRTGPEGWGAGWRGGQPGAVEGCVAGWPAVSPHTTAPLMA